MPSKKISELQTLSVPAGEDLLLIIDDPSGSPQSKKITLRSLIAQLPSNTTFKGTTTMQGNVYVQSSNTYITANVNISGITKVNSFTTSNNKITIAGSFTPANSTVTGYKTGTIAWDSSYLYIRTSNTTFKRTALSSF